MRGRRASYNNPAVKLAGDAAERIPAHQLVIAVGVEEADDALGLLEGLDHAVEKDPVEAPVAELDAIVVVLLERVHGALPRGEIPGACRHGRAKRASASDRVPPLPSGTRDKHRRGAAPRERQRAILLSLGRLLGGDAGISRAKPLVGRSRHERRGARGGADGTGPGPSRTPNI